MAIYANANSYYNNDDYCTAENILFFTLENKSPVLLQALTKILDKAHKDGYKYMIQYLQVPYYIVCILRILKTKTLQSDAQPMEEIRRIGIFSPYILFIGDDKVHPTQYFVVCENEVLSETTDFIKALVALFAWYYVMDIEYPKLCRNTYNFIEAKCLKLPSTGNFTANSIQVISSMEQLDTV